MVIRSEFIWRNREMNMNSKQKLIAKMSILEHEISETRTELMKKEIRLSGYREAFEDMFPATQKTKEFREGSMVSKAHNFLKVVGKPQKVDEILEGIGLENTKDNIVSLLNTLASYARKEKSVFTKPEPNTFGLKEFESNNGNQKTADVSRSTFFDPDDL